MRLGSLTQSIPLDRWTGELPCTRGHWCVCRCVEGACEEIDWGLGIELVGEEEQEVVLVDFKLVAFSGRFWALGMLFRFMTFMIFTTY